MSQVKVLMLREPIIFADRFGQCSVCGAIISAGDGATNLRFEGYNKGEGLILCTKCSAKVKVEETVTMKPAQTRGAGE